MSTPALVSPVPGRLTSRYGYRVHPVTGKRGDFHAGEDVACPVGTPVRAPEPGRIVYTGWAGSGLAAGRSGLCVILRGDWTGRDHYFGHLSEFEARTGEHVDQLDVLARSGATGNVTGPHCHVEVRTAGTTHTAAPAAFYAAHGAVLGHDPMEDHMTPAQEAKIDRLTRLVEALPRRVWQYEMDELEADGETIAAENAGTRLNWLRRYAVTQFRRMKEDLILDRKQVMK